MLIAMWLFLILNVKLLLYHFLMQLLQSYTVPATYGAMGVYSAVRNAATDDGTLLDGVNVCEGY